ncbi:DUF3298 and DUF4163 domain-containing protein [Bhargavaea massiliensis]|uniref:DUF3298 and DUF4163 domain-containing protein n=1 Tax=Bhargavaea massiliensis TaxID=2697500 RepID=UPI001BCABFC0|nr:DUF3298 and DUF4163 domain-containing protein [Bhargavaea massiliensis]
MIPIPFDLPVQIVTHPVRMESPKIDLVYPQVTGLANPAAQSAINLEIVTEFALLLQQLGYGNQNLVEMTGYYEVKTNERDVLSLLLVVYSFTGGAHGLTLAKALTFDVRTGKRYRLGDLFKPDSGYTEVLSGMIGGLIKEWEVPELEPFESISPGQDFYMADHSLTVFFQLYELTPYVYGFPYFPIPLKSLESIIADSGPASSLLPF